MSSLCFKANNSKLKKTRYSFSDSKQRRMAFSRVKKTASIIIRNNTAHDDDFYCLVYLHSFRTKNKLGSHKKVCESKDFCNAVMPSEETRILEFNQYL